MDQHLQKHHALLKYWAWVVIAMEITCYNVVNTGTTKWNNCTILKQRKKGYRLSCENFWRSKSCSYNCDWYKVRSLKAENIHYNHQILCILTKTGSIASELLPYVHVCRKSLNFVSRERKKGVATVHIVVVPSTNTSFQLSLCTSYERYIPV